VKQFQGLYVYCLSTLKDGGEVEADETASRSLGVVSHHGVRDANDQCGFTVVEDEVTHPEGFDATWRSEPFHVEEDVCLNRLQGATSLAFLSH